MDNIRRILIIIQRSNGDVLFSNSLVNRLRENYPKAIIDLLINDDTISIGKLIPSINEIITFSYHQKEINRTGQEIRIIKKIFRKYDLSINLTASDRSVIYSIIAAKKSISAVEFDTKKSWWKKLLLKHYYFFDKNSHILVNNLKSLRFLKIHSNNSFIAIQPSNKAQKTIKNLLIERKISDFLIFHPGAQYEYKVYPKRLRHELLCYLNSLNIPIIVTGGISDIDLEIRKNLPSLKNVSNLIGETTIDEFIALAKLSRGFIGMDTLNMHIASSQNKKVFAIMGPTNLNVWSPWSNISGPVKVNNSPYQVYGNNHIFQAEMPCVPCGAAGCSNLGIKSECLNEIKPEFIFSKVKIQLTL